MKKHPAIIAHRVASEHNQDTSLSSIFEAIALGAEIIEVDVRTTKDRVLVLSHNDRLSFLKGTKISKLTYAELKKRGYKPQKLQDVLKALPPDILLNLDLKDTRMDLALAEILKSEEDQKRIIFDSNNVGLLDRYQYHFPKAKHSLSNGTSYNPLNISSTFVGRLLLFFLPLLLSYPSKRFFRWKVNKILPEYISFFASMCTQQDVDFYHSLGVKVMVYTVNSEKAMQKFIDMGVDGIKTDQVELLTRVIQQQ